MIKKKGENMKSTNYSDKVMDHFRNPRNTGVLTGDNVAVGRVGKHSSSWKCPYILSAVTLWMFTSA